MKWIIVAICLHTSWVNTVGVTSGTTWTTTACAQPSWHTEYAFTDRRACEDVLGVMNSPGATVAYYCQRQPTYHH